MKDFKRTEAGEALTGLVLDLFRFNNQMLAAGDRLVADIGLTSARWSLLGTIISSARAQPVAWLARDMGGSRQNIQRIANDLEGDGLVVFEPNPHHKRAHLVTVTDKGRAVFEQAMRLQAPWINRLSGELSVAEIAIARRVLIALGEKLRAEEQGSGEP